ALAGFPPDAIRVVPCDDRFRMPLDVLGDMIAADRRAGRRPFLVVASGGTVNTGAVDDLTRLADLASAERLWLHVDAAYGGFFVLTERGRQALAGIELADSVTLDPHKGLFLPYGTGCLLVRDPHTLRTAHAAEGAYLPTMQDQADFVDYCQLSPELSRPFRGLRLWLPFKLLGVAPFRAALDEKLDLARYATDALRSIPDVTIVAEPELSLVAFRLEPPGLDPEAVNDLNRRLLDAVNRRKRVYITGTAVNGRYLLRICVLSFRTHRDRVDAGLDDIRAAVQAILPDAERA
ncbi:MAG: pyridoxal-dependent decarboxylase, partial [Synechococcaceae cyanobacterium]|nr:pyridoxal-dependent decarboxylase [Synechococcaceae cyanobacterium]